MKGLRSVTFIDPFAEGHHIYYASLLASGLVERGFRVYAVGCGGFVSGMKEACPVSGSEVVECPRAADVTEREKRRFLKGALLAARGFNADYIHLQQLDRFIFALFMLEPFSDLSGMLGTLHWAAILDEFAPDNLNRLKIRAERMVLRRLVKRGFRVMAHSMKFTAILNAITSSDSAGYVPYPADFPALTEGEKAGKRKGLRAQLGIPPEATVLLSFGATRFEKGADIAVRALKDLPDDVYLLVAGIGEHFTKEALSALGEKHGVGSRLRLCMDYIPEERVVEYFAASDIVVAPYRRVFAGQCGPITIAASMGIPVVGPDSMIIKETVDKYSLGKTFPAGDAAAFAGAVRGLMKRPCRPRTGAFKRDHDKKAFCDAVANNNVRSLKTK
ncbi:MAG: glycosyltransferase [Deltaproteobacteria bacterium]|nr:glycosyltransferase [Deltaproteobacteria bacterium]